MRNRLYDAVARMLCEVGARPDDRIVVAVSGGADSVCLLHLLKQIARRRGFLLHVAHLDHQFRPEAIEEAHFVEKLAQDWQLPVTIATRPVLEEAKKLHLGKQAGARAVRYVFLMETAQKVNARWIATGHTCDDQAETYLMRLLRGAGVRGQSAIPRVRDGMIIRPLLGILHRDIVAELKRSGISWVEDPSNRMPSCLRNRIRHELIPLLERYNPAIKKGLCRQARCARDEDDWIGEVLRAHIPDVVSVNREEVVVNVRRMQALHPALQRHLLQWSLRQLSDIELSFERTEALMSALRGPRGKVYGLSRGFCAQRYGTVLRMGRSTPSTDQAEAKTPNGASSERASAPLRTNLGGACITSTTVEATADPGPPSISLSGG